MAAAKAVWRSSCGGGDRREPAWILGFRRKRTNLHEKYGYPALGGLIVDEERMRHNLGISKGLIVAEAVMMGLAPALGRQQAHDVVYDACRTVNEKGGTLAQALAALDTVTARFDQAAIERLTDPANYLGQSPRMVDRAVSLSEKTGR